MPRRPSDSSSRKPHAKDGKPKTARKSPGAAVAAKAAAEQLKAISGPFLNWAGKAERQAFHVPTLPLFVPRATLHQGHPGDGQAPPLVPVLVGAEVVHQVPHGVAKQVEAHLLVAAVVNRMILGDSLVVMNNLVEYRGWAGRCTDRGCAAPTGAHVA